MILGAIAGSIYGVLLAELGFSVTTWQFWALWASSAFMCLVSVLAALKGRRP
jgi:hypothetical protein